MKRDPYKVLQRLALILTLAIAVGIGIFYLCSVAVTRDYVNTRDRIETENADAEVAFNARMNELRAQNAAAKEMLPSGTQNDENLPCWEKELKVGFTVGQ